MTERLSGRARRFDQHLLQMEHPIDLLSGAFLCAQGPSICCRHQRVRRDRVARIQYEHAKSHCRSVCREPHPGAS